MIELNKWFIYFCLGQNHLSKEKPRSNRGLLKDVHNIMFYLCEVDLRKGVSQIYKRIPISINSGHEIKLFCLVSQFKDGYRFLLFF